MIDRDGITERLQGTHRALESLAGQIDRIETITTLITERLTRGHTLYTAGNGGSAAEALHLAEELVGRYRGDRPPYAAVCLAADPTAMTCIANDFGFDQIFARPCEAMLVAEDVLVVLSTSGKSPNILAALAVANEKGATTIGLLGGDGGPALAHCAHAIVIDSDDSAHVQEAHLVVVHLLCEAVERVSA